MLEYIEYIKKNNLGVVYTNKTFKDLTTLKIGGRIALLYYPNTIDNFIDFYKFYLMEKNYPIIVLGNGSNILASNQDYNGIVISFKKLNFKYSIFNNILTVSSGVMINDIIHYLKEYNLGGLEKLYYIPATVGGMIKMNASAYDSNISDNIIIVKTIDKKGNIKSYKKQEINFEYRQTNISEDEIIIEAIFKLKTIEKKMIIKELEYIKENRRKKYPLNHYNAGSTFKNPNDNKSWLLIDNVRLRGLSVNDACVSNKHCNFLINKKNCSSDDMINLLNIVINSVETEYNVRLECEWNLINF